MRRNDKGWPPSSTRFTDPGPGVFPESRENIFAGCESDPIGLQTALSISGLGGFSKTAGSGIFVPVAVVGSGMGSGIWHGLSLA
jgi:hypothetical protein